MALEVLKGISISSPRDNKPQSAPLKDKYGNYGFGPQDKRKYYLRDATPFDDALLGRNRIPKIPKSTNREPETQWIIIPDLVRPIRVPSKQDPSKRSIIMDKASFERIKSAAQVLSLNEKDNMMYKCMEENKAKMEASLKRRERLQEIDRLSGREPKRFEEIDQEIKEQEDALLKRANDIRLEQEEEMKELNKRLTAIKNAAIHERQIANKQRLQSTLEEEEKRLERMMEEERMSSIRREQERQNKLKDLGKKYGQLLLYQIKDNEQIRQLEQEKLFQEKKDLLKSMANTLDDFDEEFRKKRQKQKVLKQALDDCVEGLMHRILEDNWQQKIRDKEAEVYTLEQDRKNKEREDEKNRVRRLRQERLDRNSANFHKMIVNSVDWHDVRVRREVENDERRWRQQQKEDQMKQRLKLEALKRMRDENLALKHKISAVYLQEEKEQYEMLIKGQKEAIVREREVEKKRKETKREIAKVQLQQIKDSEAKRIRDRALVFADGVKILDQKEKIMKEMTEMKKEKLAELQKQCPELPDKFVKFVNNKVQITPVLKMKFDQKITRHDR